ncbi:FG-GAP repeat protein [Hyphomonas oceanitis]|uniref:Serralysin n=1 Tax=Hyphomonas oceanitis SCH89 TaxID=1280953 RepID=A0A059G9J7_9PROT|nr:FG-GAP repeat protein [Hyphomonas oceanitis]KDA03158.1 serralysin [Hyphomonas oceanitis SCH89]
MNFVIWRRAIAAMILAYSLAACGGGGSDNGGGSGGGGSGGGGGGSSNAPPQFTSPTSFTFPENTIVSFTLAVSDPEGDTVTIRDDTTGDGALFTVDPTTGGVIANTSNNSFDFENPQDGNQDNVYEQNITLSDGKNTVRTVIKVTITDVDEPPYFTNVQVVELNENQTGPLLTFTAVDPEGAAVSNYKIVQVSKLGEPVNSVRLMASFSIDSTTGVLTVEQPFDAEQERLIDPISVVVEATDGVHAGTGGVNITIIDLPARVVEGVRVIGTDQVSPLGDFANSVGDIDGDGLDEVWISQKVSSDFFQKPIAETAYLIWGKTLRDKLALVAADLDVDEFTKSQAIKFTNETYEEFGTKISQLIAIPAGDVDGDGTPDILIGFSDVRDERYVPDTTDGPIAAVVFGDSLIGNTSGTYDLLAPPALAQVNVSGVSRREAIGLSLGAGDFDGDGRTDIVLGSPMTNGGRLVFGTAFSPYRATGALDLNLVSAGQTLLLKSIDATANRMIGSSVAALADITSDGFDELVVSGRDIAPDYLSGVYVASGQLLNAAKIANETEFNFADAINAAGVIALAGADFWIDDIDTKGDVDADGLNDIALAYKGINSNPKIGALVFGSAVSAAMGTGSVVSLDFIDASNGVSFALTDQIFSTTTDTRTLVRFASNFADGPGDELMFGFGWDNPLRRREAGSVLVFKDRAISGAVDPLISLLNDNIPSSIARKFMGIAADARVANNFFAADLDGDGIVDLSFASEQAGDKDVYGFSGAFYTLPGTVMQQVFAGDSGTYDLATSLANETPVD